MYKTRGSPSVYSFLFEDLRKPQTLHSRSSLCCFSNFRPTPIDINQNYISAAYLLIGNSRKNSLETLSSEEQTIPDDFFSKGYDPLCSVSQISTQLRSIVQLITILAVYLSIGKKLSTKEETTWDDFFSQPGDSFFSKRNTIAERVLGFSREAEAETPGIKKRGEWRRGWRVNDPRGGNRYSRHSSENDEDDRVWLAPSIILELLHPGADNEWEENSPLLSFFLRESHQSPRSPEVASGKLTCFPTGDPKLWEHAILGFLRSLFGSLPLLSKWNSRWKFFFCLSFDFKHRRLLKFYDTLGIFGKMARTCTLSLCKVAEVVRTLQRS